MYLALLHADVVKDSWLKLLDLDVMLFFGMKKSFQHVNIIFNYDKQGSIFTVISKAKHLSGVK